MMMALLKDSFLVALLLPEKLCHGQQHSQDAAQSRGTGMAGGTKQPLPWGTPHHGCPGPEEEFKLPILAECEILCSLHGLPSRSLCLQGPETGDKKCHRKSVMRKHEEINNGAF